MWQRVCTLLTISDARIKKIVIYCSFLVAEIFVFFMHVGVWSPYTYGIPLVHNRQLEWEIDGHFQNWDAPRIINLIHYFYKPTESNFGNIGYFDHPLIGFIVSTILGITKSYLLSWYIANLFLVFLLFVVLTNFLLKFKYSYTMILLIGLNVLFMPFFSHYFGQGLLYVISVAINFIVLITVMSLSHDGYKNPAIYGLLVGIITLTHEWYAYFFALFCYFLFTFRFRFIGFGVYLLFSILPNLLWHYYVHHFAVGVGEIWGTKIRNDAIAAWSGFLKNPFEDILFPYVTCLIGLNIAFKMLTALIYWPVLFFVIYHLIKGKNNFHHSNILKLVLWLFLGFLIKMFLIVPFEYENISRRAIETMFIFGVGLAYVVWKIRAKKAAIVCLVAVTLVSLVLIFSDIVLRNPVIQAGQYAELVRASPKDMFGYNQRRLNPKNVSYLKPNKKFKLFNYNHPGLNKRFIGDFCFSQILCFVVMFFFLVCLQMTKLINNYSVFIFVSIYLLSLLMR